jgi:hypothetical protein
MITPTEHLVYRPWRLPGVTVLRFAVQFSVLSQLETWPADISTVTDLHTTKLTKILIDRNQLVL